MKQIFPILTLTLSMAVMASANTYLNIGDSAPSLEHVSWLKGHPTTSFEKGKVYVVEFWATWCGPCKANIPNLTALAKKYAGKVSISGIDIWESTDPKDTTYTNRVSAFVKKEGNQMDYNVGVDDLAKGTANAWMKASEEGGIPMSFVIGKDGKIAWMGHAEGLDQVLEAVTAGTFDVSAARDRRATEVEIIRPVKEAMDAKQFAKALALMDQNIAKRPNMARYYQYDQYTAYTHIDLVKTKEVTAQIIKDSGGEIGAYQMMSSVYATQPDLTAQAYEFGMSIISEALAKKDREYMFLSMASAVSGFQHNKPKALEYAKAAVAAAQKDSHAPAPFIEFLKRNVTTIENDKAK